jgi:DNA primase
MRLPDSFLEELRARTPLAALIGRRVKLARSGRHWKACCPFHAEKSPSFYVYEDGYHCFGCGAHGDAIGFVMQSQGAAFMDAVEALASEAGLEVPKPSPAAAQAEQRRLDLHGILAAAAGVYQRALFAPGGAAALAYLRRRGLTDETIARFGLGWAGEGRGALAQALAGEDITPVRLMEAGLLRPGEDGAPRGELFFNRVMFPIRDRRGRVISFGGRTMGDGQPKYVNGPETPVFSKRRTLYGLDVAREAGRARQPIVVVEGYMDVIALHQAGFAGAVAPLGTALTEDQLELLWQMSPSPVLCFDGDAAGARAAARAADVALPRLAPDRTIRIATLPAGEDPDTLIKSQGAARFTAVLDGARPLAVALFDLLRETAPTASPEQRAAFRARLEAACARIGDRGLAQEYRRDLMDRYFAASRRPAAGTKRATAWGAAPAPAIRRADRPVASDAGTFLERCRTLAAILLRHPGLAHRLEDALAQLPLPPRVLRLVEAILGAADVLDVLDFTSLIAHLPLLDLADDVAWALADLPCPSPSYAGASATASEAEAGWWHIYGLMRGTSLEAEIAAARARFTADPSEAAQQRLIALCAAQDLWRRGEDESADAEHGLEELSE